MDLLGALNPGTSQAAGNATMTAQQQQQAQDLANILKKEGQNTGNKQFTSPWQVVGQWASALAGKAKQDKVNQATAALNAQLSPGPQAPVQGSPAQALPGSGGQPAIPGQSPASPNPTVLPWSGADAGTQMPDLSALLTG